MIVALPYLQMHDDALLCLDDADYLGREVRRGITWQNVRWAFGYHEANWHPLTWLSHMLDWQLAPMHSGWFKFHNLLLHLGSVTLFFLFLRRAGELPVYAALATLVFGVHPLRVSSVAWVAERKDCLCVFFCVATMLAYQAYATRTSWGRYGLVTALMALAMMAKPLAVSLPIGLLLLDVWPLERTGRRDAAGILALAAEKVPFSQAGVGFFRKHPVRPERSPAGSFADVGLGARAIEDRRLRLARGDARRGRRGSRPRSPARLSGAKTKCRRSSTRTDRGRTRFGTSVWVTFTRLRPPHGLLPGASCKAAERSSSTG